MLWGLNRAERLPCFYLHYQHNLVTLWARQISSSLTLSLTRYQSHPGAVMAKGWLNKTSTCQFVHTTKIRFLGPLYCSSHVPKNIENNWIGMDRVNNSVMYPARHKSNSAFNLSRRRMKVAKRYLVEQLLLAFVVKILKRQKWWVSARIRTYDT